MACFIVSAAEAAVVTAVEKIEEKKEQAAPESEETTAVKIPLSRKLKWLSYMLWGGSFLLMFEHVWHGEVTPWFPFLTAMSDKAEMMTMLHEMATVGVAMAVLVTVVWAGICVTADIIVKRENKVSA
ncbi:MAG TPA: hypothetical protein DEO83_01345 [Lachnospiraceae bacterium]|jgi:hypothetical protein|nr:hypothetical protein [Lachnospiraceae bacterium]